MKVRFLLLRLQPFWSTWPKCSPPVKGMLEFSPFAIQHLKLGQRISLDVSCLGATSSASTWFSQCAAVWWCCCRELLARRVSLCCSVCSVLHVSLSSLCVSQKDTHTDTQHDSNKDPARCTNNHFALLIINYNSHIIILF